VQIPLLTPELAMRLEKCDTAFIAGRLMALQKLEGNPYGAEVRAFGSATGLMVRGMAGNSLFNRLADFSPAELGRLDEIINWYQENNLNARFDLLPSHVSPELFKALAGRGFYQSGFYTVLYGLPQTRSQEFPGVEVRTVGPEELAVFDDIYMEGFGFPSQNRPVLTTSLHALLDNPSNRFYLALVDGQPAGMAILLIHDNIGYMATATTLAAFRGRGCQKALMYRRIQDAAASGCQLITSQTHYASLSQSNMEKVGLRLAYNKAIWTKLRRD
jgi:hypothetical protein